MNNIWRNRTGIEEAKRIHKKVIDVMLACGYGLLTDGETFYQKGMELEPRSGITFTMNQAYVVSQRITQQRERAVREFVKYTEDVLKSSTIQGTKNADVDFAMDMQMTQMFPDMLKALISEFLKEGLNK